MNFYFERLNSRARETFEATMKEAENEVMRTESLIMDFNHWFSAIPIEFSHHIIEVILMNMAHSLESSFFLAMSGFYNSANSDLRTALDGLLTRIYFLILDLNSPKCSKITNIKKGERGSTSFTYEFGDILNKMYFPWEDGKDYENLTGKKELYPPMRDIKEVIFSNMNIKSYNHKYNFKTELGEFYSYLSKCSHDRPDCSNRTNNSGTNIVNNKFDKGEFKQWINNIQRLYINCVILLVLVYPKFRESEQYKIFKEKYKENSSKIESVSNSVG